VVISKVSNVNINALGTYTIVYTATDGAGNKASVTRTVNVVDRAAPVITLLGTNPFNMTRYKPYVDPGYQITDNYYLASQVTVIVNASGVINHTPGYYRVIYSAKDPSGNKSSVERLVNVGENSEVGIEEQAGTASFKVFPNPTKGKLNISWVNKSIESVRVYSILGTLVAQVAVDKNSSEALVDLTGLKDGIYIVRLDGHGDNLMKKVNLVK
jgi:hypothetical protein